jgi:hypothetical protein
MSAITKAFITAGSITGKAGAYAWEGTRLGATSFAQGAKQGYTDKAAELRAQRLEVAASRTAAITVQSKLKTAKA